MTALTSKIQYRNFEEGEFTEEQERTFEETIQLIENFPWQQQREHFVVGLTAPSITIKNKEGDYLKLLLYYNQKFILHFFDSNHDHYTKNFLYLKDAYNDIHDFCTTSINRHEFKFEGRNAHIKKHFANKDFTYKLTLQNSLLQFFGNGGYNIFMSLFLLYITSFQLHPSNNPTIAHIIILIWFLTVGGGINILFLINYYRHSKGKSIKVSQGKNQFTYTENGVTTEYSKSDIVSILTIAHNYNKSFLNGISFSVFTFKNGSSLFIPNILISEINLYRLFSGCPHKTVCKFFPFIGKKT